MTSLIIVEEHGAIGTVGFDSEAKARDWAQKYMEAFRDRANVLFLANGTAEKLSMKEEL